MQVIEIHPEYKIISENDESLSERGESNTALFDRNLHSVTFGTCQGHLVVQLININLKMADFLLQKKKGG